MPHPISETKHRWLILYQRPGLLYQMEAPMGHPLLQNLAPLMARLLARWLAIVGSKNLALRPRLSPTSDKLSSAIQHLPLLSESDLYEGESYESSTTASQTNVLELMPLERKLSSDAEIILGSISVSTTSNRTDGIRIWLVVAGYCWQ
jgi:hypothetical protein